jgi:hypothetical protein
VFRILSIKFSPINDKKADEIKWKN